VIKLGQPAEDYHLDPAIGSSRAQLMLDSPQLFKDELDGLVEHTASAAKVFGTVFHLRVLQPEEFHERISTGPINPKTGKPFGADTKAMQEWAAENPDKIAMGEAELATMERMIYRCPAEVRAIFARPGRIGASIYQTAEGVAVKCRPDHWHDDLVTDLKTIDDITGIRSSMRTWRYWFQQEWYKRILLGETGVPQRFQFVFAEKKPPYRWRVVHTNEEVCEEAALQVRGVLTMLREAQRTSDWADRMPLHETITWPDCGHYEEGVA